MLPGLNFVVLDANQLMVPATITDLFAEYRRTDQRIFLPWVHVFEQTKAGSAAWFDRVHDLLRPEPRAVHFAYPAFVVGGHERGTQRPQFSRRAIEDRRNTVLLRQFLANPAPTTDIAPIQQAVGGFFRKYTVPDWARILTESVKVDTEDEARAIRRGLTNGDRQPLREAIIGYARLGRLEVALGQMLRVNGASWRRAAALVRYPSQSALMLLAYILLGMRRKYQTPKKENEDNIACDLEAVFIALYGRRLVSADKYALELDEDLRIIARQIWA